MFTKGEDDEFSLSESSDEDVMLMKRIEDGDIHHAHCYSMYVKYPENDLPNLMDTSDDDESERHFCNTLQKQLTMVLAYCYQFQLLHQLLPS